MSSFELNTSDWYEVQACEENTFINANLQSTEYGIYYSVQFVGDAETYLWQTKTKPTEGEKYWGMLVKAKSGKSIKFKWDKKNSPDADDGRPTKQEAKEKSEYWAKKSSDNSKSITLGLVYKTIANIRGLPDNAADSSVFWEMVKEHTDELINISEKLNLGSQSPVVPTSSDETQVTKSAQASPEWMQGLEEPHE